MQLDSYTVLVAGCAVLALLGCTFVYFWVQDRRSTQFLWWGIPLIFGSATLLLYTQPGATSVFLSISLGNLARMLIAGCLWNGVRVFERRRPMVWPLVGLAIVWMALCLTPAFATNIAARIIAVSLVNVVFCALTAFELWRGRADNLPSRRPLMVVFISISGLLALRLALAGVAPFPVGTQMLDAAWLGGLMLLVFGHTSFATALFVSISKERREAEQRSFAMSDPLTGLMNRRAFADHAGRVARRRGGRETTALMVLDLDHFKSINDRFGHDVGDRMLMVFAEVAEKSVRASDRLYRMGGEEFCFVLPETSTGEALIVAERVRQSFEAARVAIDHGSAHGTVSIGIAWSEHAGVDLDLLLAAADAALYEAKARGRNRVVVADPSSLRSFIAADLPSRRSA